MKDLPVASGFAWPALFSGLCFSFPRDASKRCLRAVDMKPFYCTGAAESGSIKDKEPFAFSGDVRNVRERNTDEVGFLL